MMVSSLDRPLSSACAIAWLIAYRTSSRGTECLSALDAHLIAMNKRDHKKRHSLSTPGARPYEIEIGVPSGSSFASSVMSGLASRMHPWLTARPMLAASFVPCSPIWPGPPPKLLNTSE